MVTRISGWQTSDGSIHRNEYEARDHEERLRFVKWCDSTFRGGEYSSSMIAAAVLSDWVVTAKSPEVREEPTS
jgi:hypothetical protein